MILSERDLPSMDLDMTDKKKEFEILQENLLKQEKAEDKLSLLLEFLENSISQSGTPHFKDFWEARKLCLDLFKKVENPLQRTSFWNKYSELSKEARRLKEILDKESAFNVEQIEVAIAAIEKDVDQIDISLQPALQFHPSVASLSGNFSFYEPLQKELNVLNAYAMRINSLRKELIKIEMRIRQKNKFFSRLSQLGDKVFPKRKELIEQISDKFKQDVDLFLKTHFANDSNESPFWLRDEIKGLQAAAKTLTLSTQVFRDTRLSLSECWDKLKEREKEIKKYRHEQKEAHKENVQKLSQMLFEIENKFKEKQISSAEASKELKEFVREMKNTDLGRDDVKALREQLDKTDDTIYAQEKSEEEERSQLERAKDQERKEKILGFKNKIIELISQAEELTLEEIISQKDTIAQEISASNLARAIKQELEKEFKPFKDILTEKRESKLLTLPENDRLALSQLKELLQERKMRRAEIKKEIDALRKNSGTSGLDFEKAIMSSNRMNEEKERLEKINLGIKEIEEKIILLEKTIG